MSDTITLELDVEVTEREDEYPDLSWLGEFHNDWRPGCIDRRRRAQTARCTSEFQARRRADMRYAIRYYWYESQASLASPLTRILLAPFALLAYLVLLAIWWVLDQCANLRWSLRWRRAHRSR